MNGECGKHRSIGIDAVYKNDGQKMMVKKKLGDPGADLTGTCPNCDFKLPPRNR